MKWISLSFNRASGGASNGARWGTKWRRIYWRHRKWTPLIVCHFRRLPTADGI
jgi:hypothetical protein